MATAVKTWTWDATTESFGLTPGDDSTLVRDTGNGDPGAGSIRHVCSGRNKNTDTNNSIALLQDVSWETLGVPAGATVTDLQVTSVHTYYGLTNSNTVDLYGPVTVHCYAANTTTEVTGAAPYTRSASASADGAWQDQSGASGAVNASYQASTTTLDVQINLRSDNGNNASAASSVHIDSLEFTITYETAGASATGSLTTPAATLSGSGSQALTSSGALTFPVTTLSGTGAYVGRTTTAEVGLASVNDPGTATDHSIVFRARVQSDDGAFYAALYEGSNNRSGDLGPQALGTALANYTASIGTAQADSITDYSSLSIRFWGESTASATFELDYIALRLPEASATDSGALVLAPATISGTASQALSASGQVDVTSVTISGTAAQTNSSTGALTTEPATIAGTGTTYPVLTATGALVLGASSVDGTAEAYDTLTASGALSLAASTISGTADLAFEATGAVALSAITIDGTGDATAVLTSTGALDLAAVTISGTAAQINSATGALTTEPVTINGTADQTNAATGSLTLEPVTINGTADQSQDATGALTLPAVTISGTGDAAAVIEATGALVLASVTITGSGDQNLSATGSLTGEPVVISGTGIHSEGFTATGSVVLGAVAISGTGAEALTATGALTSEPVTINATASQTNAATGSLTGETVAISGTAAQAHTATGSVVLGVPTLDGTGAFAISGSGTVTLPAVVIDGTAESVSVSVEATGDVSTESIVIDGTGFSPVIAGTGGRRRRPQPEPPKPALVATGSVSLAAMGIEGSGRNVYDDLWQFLEPELYLLGALD